MSRGLFFTRFSVSLLFTIFIAMQLTGCSDGPMGAVEQGGHGEHGDTESSNPQAPDLTGQSAPAPRFSPHGIKQVAIDWDELVDADHYRLWISDNGGQAYMPAMEVPAGTTVIHELSAHLTLNTTAYLEACNSMGCTEASPEARLIDQHEAGAFSLADVVGLFQSSAPISHEGRTLTPLLMGVSLAVNRDGSRWVSGIPAFSEYLDDDITASNWHGGFVSYDQRGGGWVLEEFGFAPDQRRGGDLFGLAMVMSGDGHWLIVSAPGRSLELESGTVRDAGMVYVYRRNNRDDGWSWVQSIAPPSPDAVGQFGQVLGLSEDGSTLVVVTPSSETNRGRVHLYRLDDDYYEWQQTIVNPGQVYASKRFGEGIALSRDGSMLAVGAPNVYGTDPLGGGTGIPVSENTEAAVGLWSRDQGKWTKVGSVVLKDSEVSGFGERLLFFGDAGYLLIGASDSRDGRGSALLYRVSEEGASMQLVSHFNPPGHVTDVDSRGFGMRIAATAEGDVLAIAAPYSDVNVTSGGTGKVVQAGAVFVYRAVGEQWMLETVQTPPLDGQRSIFGSALALGNAGRTLLVGAAGQQARASDGNETASADIYHDIPPGAVFMY